MSDEEAMQQDLEAKEQLALDCLMNCRLHGLEGTADILAPMLGLSKQWKEIKAAGAQRIAA
jgi:hypothetical protein